MNSCLYDCVAVHKRSAPKRHAFRFPFFMFYLDIDELETLDRSFRLFGRNRFSPYEFRDSDHYLDGHSSIKASIESYIRSKGVEEPIGSIRLLTNLRTWGHVFNPVSFYFVFDPSGQPICSVAEVGNTFNEQKLYLASSDRNGASRADSIKRFYVSPFSDLETTFHFRIGRPGEAVRIAISQSRDGETYFQSVLSGKRRPLKDRSLALRALRFPLVTLQIVGAIHWQAFRLYLKGIPFRRKADNPEQQTDTRPYLVNATHRTF
jgi:DUF1365 family protein